MQTPEREKQSMPGPTINVSKAHKRIAAINSRLERYPDHPQKEKMLSMLDGYKKSLDAVDAPKPDRLLSRVATLVESIRKIVSILSIAPDHPMKDRMLKRRTEYQTSLRNIQEFGRERVPSVAVGVKIEVPADVFETRSE